MAGSAVYDTGRSVAASIVQLCIVTQGEGEGIPLKKKRERNDETRGFTPETSAQRKTRKAHYGQGGVERCQMGPIIVVKAIFFYFFFTLVSLFSSRLIALSFFPR